MRLTHLICGAILSAVLVAPATAAQPAQPFDAAVDAAKAAMMANPATALAQARIGYDLASRGPADDQQPIRIATAQWLEGEALMRLSKPADARAMIDQALAVVAARQPNTNLHGRLTLAHANLADASGEAATALADYQSAFKIFAVAGEPRQQAIALLGLGDVYRGAGDPARAIAYYVQSGEVYRDDPALLVSAHNNTGNALKDQGKADAAIAEFRQALGVAREMKSPMLQVRILENLAGAEIMAGRLADADGDIAAGLVLAARDPEAREWRPFLWGQAARVAAARGQVQQARALMDRTFQGVDLATSDAVFRDFHKAAYGIYDKAGEPALALRHLEAFKRLDDSARTLAANAGAALATARFDFATQEARIARLKAAKLEQDVELARTRGATILVMLIASGALLCVLAAGLIGARASRNRVRAANQSLERAVKARTEFLATTSHEIRTPLNAILGMTQVILADAALAAPLREKVSIVHGAGETMRALMDDILDAAKIETGNLVIEPVEIDLHALLEDARKLWHEPASAKGVALTVDFDQAPVRIVEDVTRLRQIVFNLMSNAIKFTKEGAVTLTATVQPGVDGEMLALRVADTGIGIPADRLEDIFESFRQVDSSTTRKYGGTGLGLAICRRLAVAMGGDLSVASELGRGSVFTVSLPLRRAAAPVRAQPTEPREPAQVLNAAAVLAVEPNPLAQSLLRAALQDEVRGLEVVGSWPEALGALSAHTFDLILADGEALEGETSRLSSLVREARGAPVVALWGGEPATVDALRAAGAAHVVAKPISTGDLIAELRDVCRARPALAARTTRRKAS